MEQVSVAIEKITKAILSSSESLDLSSLNLSTIPQELRRAVSIRRLNLSFNQLKQLPEWFEELVNLNVLDLRNNNLSRLFYNIDKLEHLGSLYLNNNNLFGVPEEIIRLNKLTYISIANNNISIIPKWVFNIDCISIGGNPIIDPPMEIYNRGLEALSNYFKEQEEGTEKLYEAKLLIVGEAGAGKTTLMNKLINADYELKHDQPSTQGIEICSYSFDTDENNRFRINIWDFGGQEIYHTTHQFFLTKRSLYILVSDNRAEDTDFNYWLQNVELLSSGSPLIIVQNEKHNRKKDINESGMRDRFRNLIKVVSFNIANDRKLLRNIIRELRHQIQTLPHVGTHLPKIWVDIRRILEKTAIEKPYISEEQYLSICSTFGMLEKDRALFLSNFLHDLGVFLHFSNNSVLKRWIILRPDWGTQAVYKILDNDRVISNNGYFSKDDLNFIWSDDEYSNMHEELIALMKMFELCYEVENTNIYIAAQLLPREKPRYNWQENNNLIVNYDYEFMPKGIITRFIVRVHHLILNDKIVWREGVVIEKDNTRAEIIETYGKRSIRIRLQGTYKRELLAIIFEYFDKIHFNYDKLRVKKLIPCNCEFCKNNQEPHFFEFDITRKLIEKEILDQLCTKSYLKVKNFQLIENIVPMDRKDTTIKVFLSFAVEDEVSIDHLLKHFKPLERNKNIIISTKKI
jgi:internalin A